MGLHSKRNKEKSLTFGGQALIEGVMFRSKRHLVMCVRQTEDKILTHVEEIHSLSEKHRILRLPFIRGIIALLETMYLGIKGIHFSAIAVLEEEQVEEFTWKEWTIIIIFTIAISSLFFCDTFPNYNSTQTYRYTF